VEQDGLRRLKFSVAEILESSIGFTNVVNGLAAPLDAPLLEVSGPNELWCTD